MKNKFCIVYTIDLSFVNYFLVSIKSLIKTNLDLNLYFYIICSKDDELYIRNLIINVLFIDNFKLICINNNALKNLKISNHFTIVNYYRFLIDKYVQEKQVLYVDSDTFIVDSLEDLIHVDLNQFYLAAVENPNYFYKKKINLNSSIPYFNSGILLLNLDLIRRDKIFEKAITFAKNQARNISFPDQCSLNSVVNGNFILLEPKFNLQTVFFNDYSQIDASDFTKKNIKNAIESPIIIHFTGKYKPLIFNFKHPHIKQYRLFTQNNLNYNLKINYDLIYMFKSILMTCFFKFQLNKFFSIFNKDDDKQQSIN